MAGGLQITVDGQWQNLAGQAGDVRLSTIWPGGSDELSWVPGSPLLSNRYRGGKIVNAYLSGVPLWSGQLVEPDPSQDRMIALGAWRLGEAFAAIDGSGNATKIPNTAVDQAIIRGLSWTRLDTWFTWTSNVGLDTTQGPVRVSDLMDQWAIGNNYRWGVGPTRLLYAKQTDTVPSFQTLPMENGLGYALDNYASTLIGRYLDSATSTWKTVTVTDAGAEANHGHIEAIVDLSARGTISTATATAIITNLLSLGWSVPKWSRPIQLSYGDILSPGGTLVALESVQAGVLLRVQSPYDMAERLNGQAYLDVPIGRTELYNGILSVYPLDTAIRTLADALAAALSKKG